MGGVMSSWEFSRVITRIFVAAGLVEHAIDSELLPNDLALGKAWLEGFPSHSIARSGR